MSSAGFLIQPNFLFIVFFEGKINHLCRKILTFVALKKLKDGWKINCIDGVAADASGLWQR